MSNRGKQLVDRISRGDDGALANELLSEFFSGHPIEDLKPLLASSDERVVKTAAWLASELGEKASRIIDSITPLLHSPSKQARFFAIDAVLVCATQQQAAAIADAIALLVDAEPAVRWKAAGFVAKASLGQLAASVGYQEIPELSTMTAWAIRLDATVTEDMSDVLRKLTDDRPSIRLFAAAAAARLIAVAPELLQQAAASQDAEVASFASEFIER